MHLYLSQPPAARPRGPEQAHDQPWNARGNLGSNTGTVATGSTVGAADSYLLSCPGSGTSTQAAGDIAFRWQAPTTGTYRFATTGSSFDTVLAVFADVCGGAELACDDDDTPVRTSTVNVAVTQGQVVLIVLDGWGTTSGNYTLTIE